MRYSVELAKLERETVGFLPDWRLAEICGGGGLLIARENGETCGYLAIEKQRTCPAIAQCLQVAVQIDVRRRHHALQVVRDACGVAVRAGCLVVQAKCAMDLEANAFWRSLGFEAVDEIQGGISRRRRLTVWRLALREGVSVHDHVALPWTDPRRGPGGRFAPGSQLERSSVA